MGSLRGLVVDVDCLELKTWLDYLGNPRIKLYSCWCSVGMLQGGWNEPRDSLKGNHRGCFVLASFHFPFPYRTKEFTMVLWLMMVGLLAI